MQPEHPEKPALRLRWVIAVLLLLSTAINYLDRQALSILATTIQRELAIDDAGYARITSYFLLSYTIMYAVSGRLLDFLGTRLGLAVAVGGWSVAGMLHGLAGSIAQLSGCRFLLGAFESANYPGGARAVAEWFPIRERALGMAFLGAGGAIGAMVAFPLVSLLALSHGWRTAFVVAGAVGFLWVIAWLAVCRALPTSASPVGEDRQPFPLRALLANRRAWGCILIRVFTDPIIYFISFWVPKYLAENHGYTLVEIGKFAWLPFAGLSAGQLLGGAFTTWRVGRGADLDRVRKRLMLGSSLVVLASGLLVAVTASPAVALAGVACLALGHGLWGNLAVPAEVFPAHSVAFVTGLGGTLGGVAGMISQHGIAWAAGHGGYGYVFAAFSVCPLLAFFVVVLLVGRLGRITVNLPERVPVHE